MSLMWHNVTEIKCNMDEYGSKIRKVSRCRPTVSNETILATKQEFFFTKVAPVQSITNIVLLGFWLILLPWMFISSCTAIYFFVKNFFFECLYFIEYDIRMYLFVFGWEIGHSLSTYTTKGMEGGHPKFVQVRTGGGTLKNRSYDTYVMLWNIFSALVWPSTLEHHRQQGNITDFFHHNYDYFILCDN